MGLGITNASTGGGGSTFSATLQIATDPNAVITSVNLAGDTFSGTADNSGALNLTITEPGTYTVTETDGGVESIVIADNGEIYTLTVIAFNGTMIEAGDTAISFESIAYAPGSYQSQAHNQPRAQCAKSLCALFLSSTSHLSALLRCP